VVASNGSYFPWEFPPPLGKVHPKLRRKKRGFHLPPPNSVPTDFSVIYQKPARDVVFAVSLNRSGFKAVAKGPMGVSIQE